MQAPDPRDFFSPTPGALSQTVNVVPAQGVLAVGTPTNVPALTSTVTPFAAQPYLLAGWSHQLARPVEVALYADSPSIARFPAPALGAFVGSAVDASNVRNPRNAGFFKIEYGCGGVVRTRYVDLVSARLYLGVCNNVRVTAYRYKNGLNAWGLANTDLLCTASIGESQGGAYDEMVSTTEVLVEAAATASAYINIPGGTYAIETGVDVWDGTILLNPWGTTNPDIFFESDLECQVYRLSTNALVPSLRRIKAGAFVYASTHSVAVVDALKLTVRSFMNS